MHLIFRWEEEHVVSPRSILGQRILIKEFIEKELEFGCLASVHFNANGLIDRHHPAIGFLIVNRNLFALFGMAACFKRAVCRIHSSAFMFDDLDKAGYIHESSRTEEVA